MAILKTLHNLENLVFLGVQNTYLGKPLPGKISFVRLESKHNYLFEFRFAVGGGRKPTVLIPLLIRGMGELVCLLISF